MSREDVTTPAFKAAAYDTYAEWRRHEPVKPVVLPDGQTIWLISRYHDVETVLKDDRFFKDKRKLRKRQGAAKIAALFPSIEALERNMLDVDAPDHRRLRGLVHQVFTPKRVREMSGRVEQLADERLRAARASGGMDVIADYALPIPTTVISEMLGIDEKDRLRFHGWTTKIVAATASRHPWKLVPTMLSFLRFLRRVIRHKRREPSDDLISALIQAEEESERLSPQEILAMVLVLVVAGHETTVNLIGNGVLALLEHPAELERLRDAPELLPGAIEEMLRFYSPVEVATERYAREATTIGGVTIPTHGFVGAVLASANRDEARFDDSARFDITRQPNPHLAFGDGAHFCLGAPLARLEGRIAIETLLACPGGFRRNDATEVRFRPGLNLRGLERLPIAFEG